MKRCTKCGQVKPADEFYRAANYKDGLHSQCKCCLRAAKRASHRKSRGFDGAIPGVMLRRLHKKHAEVVKYGSAVAEVLDSLDRSSTPDLDYC